MGRNIHRTLSYEKKEIAIARMQLGFLSDILYDVEKELGRIFVENKVWTHGCGITIRNTTKPEFQQVKRLLPNLTVMEKDSNEWGISLEGNCCEGTVKRVHQDGAERDYPVNLQVKFKWNVPDTCEIKTVEYTEAVGDATRFKEVDGQLYESRTKTVVECSQPVLESVFASE